MTRLVSNLRVSMHRTFFVALAGFVLTVWPAFTATAFSAQESKAKTLDSALTQTILSAQESKGKEIDVALTSTAFTYQGQLKDASGPVTGSYDFQFVLYSAQTGGEPLGASEMEDVALSNGMFSLRLDFGRLPAQAGAAADAKEGWLEIGVRPSGSAEAYTVLFPRQKLTPTPYAIFAQHEQWSLIGVPVGFAGGVETATVISDESADQGVTEAKKVSEETAKSSDSGKRKVTDAESQAAAAPQSTAGTIPKFVDANNNLGDSIIVEKNGNVGIGAPNPGDGLTIAKDGATFGLQLKTDTSHNEIVFRKADGSAVADILSNVSTTTFGAQNGGLAFFTGSSFSSPRFVINSSGNVGIGTPSPVSKVHIVSEGPGASPPRLQSSGQGQNEAGLGGFQAGWDFYHGGTGKGYVGVPDTDASFAPGELLVFGGPNTKTSIWAGSQRSITVDTNANVGIGTLNPQARLDVAGRTITNVLQITGGNFDFSEEFAVTAAPDSDSTVRLEQVRPGMVVRIDEENPGQLIVSTHAYDRRVAGIISGAGGIKPGLLMSQSSSLAEGSHPVALTGRVYCLADASFGSIEPGDLLTTSDTAGHAMKVTDHTKAHGAIIGKAMTSLKEGRGLVLVLVTLQ